MVKSSWTEDRGSDMKMKRTSAQLQKTFYTVYKDFFNTHDIVLSGSSILTWWADISHGIGTVWIKQKIPMKTFCWANLNNSGRVTFGSLLEYSILENSFKEQELDTLFVHNGGAIIWFLENVLSKNWFTKWIEIDILSETPPWHGFASFWVFSVILTFLLHIVIWKLDPKILIYQEIATQPVLFDELYNLSLELSHCISGWKSVGASNYAVMATHNVFPMVHFSNRPTWSRSSGENIMNEENTDIRRDMNHVIYKDSLFNFLWIDSSKLEEFPLDYGVIFTGFEYRYSDIESTREQKKHEEDWLDDFITRTVRSLWIPKDDRVILSELLGFDKTEILEQSTDIMNLRILEWFDSLARSTHLENSIDSFIDTIKKIGLLSFSYQKENKLFASLQYLFRQYQQFEDEDIGIFPFNTGKIWGSLFFVMKKWKSRTTIEKTLTHLQKDGFQLSLDYASWRDGYASDGVCIDQYISQKIYSDYTQEGNLLFTDTFGTSYCGDYEAIIKTETDCILLDTIWGRIYIKGTKLTSKEIHSQNTTIDMLKILIENIGSEVSNSKLPVSTYSQNKNELLSKVVIPIKKIAKEHFWMEISLNCSGWITEYYLRLEKDESIRIGIIKKLQN